MLSAPAVKKAEQAIEEALRAVNALFDKEASGEIDNGFERSTLHKISEELERAKVDFIKLECSIYGFNMWEYLSEEAIKAERWKALEQARKEEKERAYKKSANKSCKQLGLEIPYPEITE